MKRSLVAVFSITIVLLSACSLMAPTDIKVETESDPKANISGYKTFSWLASAQILYDPQGQWEPTTVDIDSEVEWLIGRELRKKGLSQVGDGADLMVAYVAGADMAATELVKDATTKFDVVKNAPKAALVIVLIDAQTGNAVWAGVAKGDVQQNRTESSIKKRLDYAVHTMFSKM